MARQLDQEPVGCPYNNGVFCNHSELPNVDPSLCDFSITSEETGETSYYCGGAYNPILQGECSENPNRFNVSDTKIK